MSLRRLNKIAFQAAKEVFIHYGHRFSNYLPANVVKLAQRISFDRLNSSLSAKRVLFKTFQRGFRNSRLFYGRPFTGVHQQQRTHQPSIRLWRPIVYRRAPKRNPAFDAVRNLFGTNARYNAALRSDEMPTTLSGYEFGDHIACGCNAAIYELRLRGDIHCGIGSHYDDLSAIAAASAMAEPDPYCSKDFPLAIKMMYNYDFATPERRLWMEMGPEAIPIVKLPPAALQGRMARFKPLRRTHPNIVRMHTAFVDRMPILEGAERLYPEALPGADEFFLPAGYEPRTLFVVMKRYRMTLREYALTRRRNYWAGRVMFGQLMEAIVFLNEHRISHRDMKSDNVLLDFESDDDVPHLVLSDFGCALASNDFRVDYDSDDVDLGGNLALRAPEIRRARPGPGVRLDFDRADMWSAGTLAYEIFTRINPFYAQLSSETYAEADLPAMPRRVPNAIKRVCRDILRVAPEERPSPQVAANAVALSLFRFGQDNAAFFEHFGVRPETLDLMRGHSGLEAKLIEFTNRLRDKVNGIVELYSTETIFSKCINPAVISNAELQLRATFLSRIHDDELHAAMAYHCTAADDCGDDSARGACDRFDHYDDSSTSL